MPINYLISFNDYKLFNIIKYYEILNIIEFL